MARTRTHVSGASSLSSSFSCLVRARRIHPFAGQHKTGKKKKRKLSQARSFAFFYLWGYNKLPAVTGMESDMFEY